MATKKIEKVVAAEKLSAAEKLRKLESSELETKIKELKSELFNLRFQAAVGKLENTAQIKKNRQEIARMMTILTERRALTK